MLTIVGIFVVSVLHEVLCVSYLIAVTDRRTVLASMLSGVLAGMNLTILVWVVVSQDKVAAIVTSVVAHSLGAYGTTKWMPRKKREEQ